MVKKKLTWTVPVHRKDFEQLAALARLSVRERVARARSNPSEERWRRVGRAMALVERLEALSVAAGWSAR